MAQTRMASPTSWSKARAKKSYEKWQGVKITKMTLLMKGGGSNYWKITTRKKR